MLLDIFWTQSTQRIYCQRKDFVYPVLNSVRSVSKTILSSSVAPTYEITKDKRI